MSRTVRQKARLMAHDQLVRRREVLVAREARIGDQVLEATAAGLERDRVIADSERRIAQAVHALVVTEAMPVGEVAELCGLDAREVNRLLRTSSHGIGPLRVGEPLVADARDAGEG